MQIGLVTTNTKQAHKGGWGFGPTQNLTHLRERESRLIVLLHSCACAACPRVQSGCHCAVGHCVIIGVTSHSASVKTSSPGSAASCLWGVALIPAAPVLLQHQPFTLFLHPATLQHPTAAANVGFGSWQSTASQQSITNMVKRKLYAKNWGGERLVCICKYIWLDNYAAKRLNWGR